MSEAKHTSWLTAERVPIRVYLLPEKLTDGYCFGSVRAITLLNVDWFTHAPDDGCQMLSDFIKSKRYYNPSRRFLVLGDHPDLTFVMEPSAAAGGDA